MDPILVSLAGLLSLILPRVLPMLPIVIASAHQRERRAPFALAAGMSPAFVAPGEGVAAFRPAVGLRKATVARAAALLMAGFVDRGPAGVPRLPIPVEGSGARTAG